jgi:hypothetical protein
MMMMMEGRGGVEMRNEDTPPLKRRSASSISLNENEEERKKKKNYLMMFGRLFESTYTKKKGEQRQVHGNKGLMNPTKTTDRLLRFFFFSPKKKKMWNVTHLLE